METESNEHMKNVLVDPNYVENFESEFGKYECKDKLLNLDSLLAEDNLYHNIFIFKENDKYYLIYCKSDYKMFEGYNIKNTRFSTLKGALEELYAEQMNNALVFSIDSLDFLKKYISSLYLCYDLKDDPEINSNANEICFNSDKKIYLSVKENTFTNLYSYVRKYLPYLKKQCGITYNNSRNEFGLKSVFEMLNNNEYVGMKLSFNNEIDRKMKQLNALEEYITSYNQKYGLVFYIYYDSLVTKKYHLIGFETADFLEIRSSEGLGHSMILKKVRALDSSIRIIIDIETDDYEFVDHLMTTLILYFDMYLTGRNSFEWFESYNSNHGKASLLTDDSFNVQIYGEYIRMIENYDCAIKNDDFKVIYETIKANPYPNMKILKP